MGLDTREGRVKENSLKEISERRWVGPEGVVTLKRDGLKELKGLLSREDLAFRRVKGELGIVVRGKRLRVGEMISCSCVT